MFKSTVTRIFFGSLIAVIAGAVLAIIAVAVAGANNVFVMSGTEVVGVRWSPLAWSMLALGTVGGLAILGGLIGGFVSWVGALLNTSQLESKTWFLVLLLLGIFNVGFFAMIAYIIVGPDGKAQAAQHRAVAPAPAA
jgi:hypothetical protein